MLYAIRNGGFSGRDHAREHRASATTREEVASSSPSTPGARPRRCPSVNITLLDEIGHSPRGRPRATAGRRVLDLKLHPRGPRRRARRACATRRGPRGGPRPGVALDERRREAAARARGPAGRAERGERAHHGRRATRPTRAREIDAMRAVAARAKELEGELVVVELELKEALAPLPNLPDPTAAPGPRTSWCARSARSPEPGFEPRDHLELAGEMIDMERAARPVGLALCLPEGRPRAARAGARALGA